MTYEEALKWHIMNYKSFIEAIWDGTDNNPFNEAFGMAMSALDKQLPRKIEKVERRPSEWGSPFICPECGSEQTPTEFFTIDGTEPKEKITWCYACGQKLDWGDQNG